MEPENLHLDGFVLQDDVWLPVEEGAGVVYLKGLDALLENEDLHNIYLDWELPQSFDRPDAVSGICTLRPYIRDEGHDQYAQMADRIYRPDNVISKYLWFQGTGRIRTIVLGCSLSEAGAIRIRKIVANARQPLCFSWIRCSVMFLLAMAGTGLYSFWKSDQQAEHTMKGKFAVVTMIGLALLVPAVILYVENGYSRIDHHFQPYQKLAEALAAGQACLLEEPSEQLMALENPYDYTARTAVGLQEGRDYLWDTAYFQGRYYTYFGIVPCLIFYLPFWLCFGTHITEGAVIFICAALFYAGVWLLVQTYCRTYHKEIPFAVQMIMAVSIFLGSNMMACMGNPDAHDVPRITGICFLAWGLYFWISSLPEECAETAGSDLKLWRVTVGSLFMALAVGCRPNLALYSFMAPVIFWKYRKSGIGTADRMKRYAALLLPYVPVAAGLMYYNAIRFGSPFDFGFAYNLTVQDCSRTVLALDKVILGVYGYLLKFPQLDYRFPYLVPGTFAELNRLGHTTVYITYCYGGLLVCNLITWCIPALFAKDKWKRDGVYIGRILAILAFLQLLVNALTGGISYNYMADFAFPLIMAGWSGGLLLWDGMRGTADVKIYKGFLILNLLWSLVFHAQFYFVSTLEQGNTELYYRIFYAFNFF
ncbi:MAG: hypothetical protein IJ600_03160 [Lachnospiraceae bacterium]|nr:hypothetical protein [Lachnospiraceae bacterium]